jgi:hypothetical protein
MKNKDYAWLLYLLLGAFAVLTSLPSCSPIYSEKSRDVRQYVSYTKGEVGYVFHPEQKIFINEEWVTNPDSTQPFIGKWVKYNQMKVENFPNVAFIQFTQNKMEIYHRVDGKIILYKILYE